jgi:hypothetical protein
MHPSQRGMHLWMGRSCFSTTRGDRPSIGPVAPCRRRAADSIAANQQRARAQRCHGLHAPERRSVERLSSRRAIAKNRHQVGAAGHPVGSVVMLSSSFTTIPEPRESPGRISVFDRKVTPPLRSPSRRDPRDPVTQLRRPARPRQPVGPMSRPNYPDQPQSTNRAPKRRAGAR